MLIPQGTRTSVLNQIYGSSGDLSANVSELELKLLNLGKITSYIFKPTDVRLICNAPRMKEDLVKFF